MLTNAIHKQRLIGKQKWGSREAKLAFRLMVDLSSKSSHLF